MRQMTTSEQLPTRDISVVVLFEGGASCEFLKRFFGSGHGRILAG
jgi:hypothetical protein